MIQTQVPVKNALSVIFIFFFILLPQTPAADQGWSKTGNPDWMKSKAAYDSTGLPDPFVPFILPERDATDSLAPVPVRPLTPLERVEISQLRLVGILWDPEGAREPAAMIELPDGKGFILQEGFRVGTRRGKVVKILPDRIIVHEHLQGDFGRSEKVQRILKLRSGNGE